MFSTAVATCAPGPFWSVLEWNYCGKRIVMGWHARSFSWQYQTRSAGSGGMGKQMTHGDGRSVAVGQGRAKIGKPSCDRIIQMNFALLNQRKRCCGDDRLGHGSEPENGVCMHGLPVFSIGKAGGSSKNDVSVASASIVVPTMRFRAKARSITRFKRSAKGASFERFTAPEDEKRTSARESALPGFIVIVTEVAELPSERKTKKNCGWGPPSLRRGRVKPCSPNLPRTNH